MRYLIIVKASAESEAGVVPAARREFERAAELTRNERERALLLARAADCQ